MRKHHRLTIALTLAACLALAQAGLSAPLSQRIARKRAQVERVQQREGVLTGTIAGYNTRIEGLQSQIGETQARLARVERALDRARAELLRVRDRLQVARDRLERLRRELRTARRVLAARLVELYKSDTPDALTVVLEADGFADLLDRTDFLERISDQDRVMVERVRRLRDLAQRQERRLAELERRKRMAAQEILGRRDQIASARDSLVSARADLAAARDERRVALARVRASRQRLEGDLAALEREQARVQAALLGASGAGGPVRRGTGALIWPVNGTIASPFGQRWGRLHAGIDIAVPAGTPIHAADSGRVALMGWVGGYGNYTCVQHTGSLTTCYAHQSRFATSNGASVGQGQVIGYVGCTGHCFGDHLHFETRVGGAPVDPMGYL
ncbi:MAG: murein hydrolase activator EnvC family protein [Nocardioidaceae bacterium]